MRLFQHLPDFWTDIRPSLLRSQLLLDAQHIINSVQDSILPPDVVLEPKSSLRRANIQRGERPDGRFLTRDDGQASLQLGPRLCEKLDSLFPREPARRYDEPLRPVGWRAGGILERQHVRARHVPHVNVDRRPAHSRFVPGYGPVGRAVDERVDEPVRAGAG